ADRLVQRDRRLDGSQRLLDVPEIEAGRGRELLVRRRDAVLRLEALPRPRELYLALVDVGRNADRGRLVRDRALTRLADPPRRVRRELVAAPPVELLDRAVEADHAL